MPGSDSGPRQGWLESARDCQSTAFLDHPVHDFVSAPLLIRGGEFKSPGSQGPEQLPLFYVCRMRQFEDRDTSGGAPSSP